MKYNEWLKQWLDHYIKPTLKERTYTRYYEIVNQHLNLHLGNYELENLTPMVIQKFVTKLLISGNLKTGKGLSPNSVNCIITVIQTSLKMAYQIGLVSDYIADKIKRPKIIEKQVLCFSFHEQKLIEEAIANDKRNRMIGILLCLYLGLRIGEVLALEWSDVDFEKSEVFINKTCYDGKDKMGNFCRITCTPKTESSCRVIPLPKQLIPYLQKVKNKSNYVVNNGNKTISVRSYQKTFASLLNRLNIPHKGFHALRHTFATRAIECGVDVKTLSEILGHKSPTITLNRCVHSLMEHKKEMMNRVGKLL